MADGRKRVFHIGRNNCPSGKLTYVTHADAKKAAKNIKQLGGNLANTIKGVIRPYSCGKCGYFHLTSAVKRG